MVGRWWCCSLFISMWVALHTPLLHQELTLSRVMTTNIDVHDAWWLWHDQQPEILHQQCPKVHGSKQSRLIYLPWSHEITTQPTLLYLVFLEVRITYCVFAVWCVTMPGVFIGVVQCSENCKLFEILCTICKMHIAIGSNLNLYF